MAEEYLITFYAIKNKEGRYFRSKGYNGSGANWVDSLRQAKIYAKPGPAKRIVSYYAEHYPTYGVPDLIELHVTKEIVIDQKDRVNKAIKKKELARAKSEERRLQHEIRWQQQKLEQANKEKERIEKALAELKEKKQ